MKTLLKAPILHFLLLGGLLYAASVNLGAGERAEKPQLEIPLARIEQARQDFISLHNRLPDGDEQQQILDLVIDREILFQHGLRMGLAEQAPVQQRLAQVASFVGAESGSGTTPAVGPTPAPELARRAMDLGLHQGDLVVRRIVTDGAERLIRGAVLSKEPTEEALEAFLAERPEAFQVEAGLKLRIAPAEAGTPPPDGGDSLPLLLPRDLDRRFGRAFRAALDWSAVGEWQGPVGSHEGPLMVLVEERRDPRPARLEEVRGEVRAAFRQDLAERWLEERVAQLRDEFEIVLPENWEATS